MAFAVNAQWNTNGSNIYFNTGKVGLGTDNPLTGLHLSNSSAPNIVVHNPGGSGALGGANFTMWDETSGSQFIFKSYSTGFGGFKIRDNANSMDVIVVENNSAANSLFIQNGGYVGIGTDNPSSALTVNGTIASTGQNVNGKITCKEVEVTLDGWSDYVFEDRYVLRPLSEVEAFIKENKHLPGIPSEKEVVENGLQVGEMNKKLMEKVEELTLYVIQLQKQIDELKK